MINFNITINYLQFKSNIFLYIIFFVLLNFAAAVAQESMTAEQAISEGLKNNYSIRVSGTESDIATQSISYGNAAFLPQLNLNLAQGTARNNTKQNLTTGLIVDKKNVGSSNISSGVSLNWTLFDGMKMFVTYEKLQEMDKLEQLKLKLEIETAVYNILLSYYEIVKEKQLAKVLQTALRLSEERIQIEETKLKLGSSSRLDFIQAKLDANESRSALYKQNIQIRNSKIKLSQLLGRSGDNLVDTKDTLISVQEISLESIKSELLQKNKSILISDENLRISNLSLRELKTERYPRIGFNANYNFSRTDNQAGFILLNQNLGFSSGFTLSMNLFDGFRLNNKLQVSNLKVKANMLLLDASKSLAESEMLSAFGSLQDLLNILKMEKENYSIAKENIEASMERYKIGNISAFQLKDAQNSYENAYSRLVNAGFEAKEAEFKLLKAGGKIIQ